MRESAAPFSVRQQLLARLADARAQTDEIFRLVRPEALYERPIPERHRIVFYIGHLEAFDWNLIGSGFLGREPFHASFDKLFAFGIDPVDGRLPTDQPADWPSLKEIRGYCESVRSILDPCLEESSAGGQHGASREEDLKLNVAIEHRLMHAETLAYMLHELPLSRKFPQAGAISPPGPVVVPWMVEIPAGTVTLGQARTPESGFGWDNEFEAHTVAVPAFRIDAYKVTNRQFVEFLRARGYEERSLWTEPGWEWKTRDGIRHPIFWTPRGESWHYRCMFEEIPLPLDWPVYVSRAEACAYAKWAGRSLPTEAQWHRAAYGTPGGSERPYPWGSEPPRAHHGNFDFHRWDPTPVGGHPAGRSAFRVADLVGNGWEWTSTPFSPFPGFNPFPFYPGYSANFFDRKHYVMKGGSARTAVCLLRRAFRNWFQPHYQYVYAGFRCVEN